MQFSYSVSELVEICAPDRTEGSSDETIRGIASLKQAGPGDLSFLGNPRYKTTVPESRASVIIVPTDFAGAPREGQVFLRAANPSATLARLCSRLEVALWPRPAPGVHPSAVVDPNVQIGAGAIIGPLCVVEGGAVVGARTWLEAGVYIGRSAHLGADCRLGPGVRVLAECELRDRVRLHAGVVIGSDGFGFETVGGKHEKLPQVGNVVVHADVEIGANSTVDRARFSSTIIGEGTKIDNLVQVGHNVVIGRHCIICAQVGVAGSATIEDYVVAGGQAGFSGHITVGKASMIGGRTPIFSDVPAGSRLKGEPAVELRLAHRLDALKKRLPEFFRRLEVIEAHLQIPRPGIPPTE